MRGFLIFLGLLVTLGGGAVAGAQYAPPDALAMLDSQPQVKEFLATPMALYAGAGAAGFGFLVILLAAFVGRKPKDKPAPKVKAAPKKTAVKPAKPEPAKPEPVRAEPVQEAPKPAPQPPVQPAPAPHPVRQPEPVAAAAAAPRPAPVAAPAPPPAAPQPVAEPPKAKPQASAAPPGGSSIVDQMKNDPRLHNRKRVGDLVTLNDALKAYHKKRGAYPVAAGLVGLPDRGAAWIPGLAPEFVAELPRDPALSMDKDGPQYVYVSDGKDYKLLARNVSLVGGTNVEVLGVKIDPTHSTTAESASFGFWTPGFASA